MFDNNQKIQTDVNQYPIAVSNILSSQNKGELLELKAMGLTYSFSDFPNKAVTLFVYSGLITKIHQCFSNSEFYEVHYLGQYPSEITLVKKEQIPYLLEKLNLSK